MSKTPENLLYADSHEWLKLDGAVNSPNPIAIVGITDHAQHELSDVVFVELPKVGKTVAAKAPIAVVESVKAASDIYSPVAGEVVEVNPELEANPALINSDPYGKGWLFKLKIAAPNETGALKDAAAYAKLIAA